MRASREEGGGSGGGDCNNVLVCSVCQCRGVPLATVLPSEPHVRGMLPAPPVSMATASRRRMAPASSASVPIETDGETPASANVRGFGAEVGKEEEDGEMVGEVEGGPSAPHALTQAGGECAGAGPNPSHVHSHAPTHSALPGGEDACMGVTPSHAQNPAITTTTLGQEGVVHTPRQHPRLASVPHRHIVGPHSAGGGAEPTATAVLGQSEEVEGDVAGPSHVGMETTQKEVLGRSHVGEEEKGEVVGGQSPHMGVEKDEGGEEERDSDAESVDVDAYLAPKSPDTLRDVTAQSGEEEGLGFGGVRDDNYPSATTTTGIARKHSHPVHRISPTGEYTLISESETPGVNGAGCTQAPGGGDGERLGRGTQAHGEGEGEGVGGGTISQTGAIRHSHPMHRISPTGEYTLISESEPGANGAGGTQTPRERAGGRLIGGTQTPAEREGGRTSGGTQTPGERKGGRLDGGTQASGRGDGQRFSGGAQASGEGEGGGVGGARTTQTDAIPHGPLSHAGAHSHHNALAPVGVSANPAHTQQLAGEGTGLGAEIDPDFSPESPDTLRAVVGPEEGFETDAQNLQHDNGTPHNPSNSAPVHSISPTGVYTLPTTVPSCEGGEAEKGREGEGEVGVPHTSDAGSSPGAESLPANSRSHPGPKPAPYEEYVSVFSLSVSAVCLFARWFVLRYLHAHMHTHVRTHTHTHTD